MPSYGAEMEEEEKKMNEVTRVDMNQIYWYCCSPSPIFRIDYIFFFFFIFLKCNYLYENDALLIDVCKTEYISRSPKYIFASN